MLPNSRLAATSAKGRRQPVKEATNIRQFLRFQQELVNESGETPPALDLLRKGAFSRLREGVEFGLPIVLGLPPGALDPSLLLQPNQRRIECSLARASESGPAICETGKLVFPARLGLEGTLRRRRGSPRGADRKNRQEKAVCCAYTKCVKINWGRACAGALVGEVAQIAAAFGWVAIYSYLINPGQPMETYHAYAQESGSWVSIIAGAPIFYAASRWIARSLPTALALFGIFVVIDGGLMAGMVESLTDIPFVLAGLSYLTKLCACALGGRHG